MKKITILLLTAVIMLNIASPTLAKSNVEKNHEKTNIENQIHEINEILSNEASNINYLIEGEYTYDIITDSKYIGSVSIKVEKLDDKLVSTRGNYTLGDGNYVTTYTFNLAINGSCVLKSYYTSSGGVTVITPTNTADYLTPPIGWTDNGHSSYYTSYSSTMFASYGTYNIQMFKYLIPLTYTIQSNFLLIPGGDANGTTLNVATFINE
jgi:hypothetical protein